MRTFALLLPFAVVCAIGPPSLGAQPACTMATLPAYAHNDYENERPLLDAIAMGFRGVEVDLFLIGDTLRVGHDRREASRAPSFEQLYLVPLREQIAQCGQLSPAHEPFFLAIEIKETSPPTWQALRALLAAYEDLFAVASKPHGTSAAPVEVVMVGWHPPLATLRDSLSPHLALSVQHRLSSDKARVDTLDPRVRLLSLDYGKTMGRWWRTETARQRWLAMLRAARVAAPDRLIRVHNVPVDARIYGELRQAGVDLLGSKELKRTYRVLTSPTDR